MFKKKEIDCKKKRVVLLAIMTKRKKTKNILSMGMVLLSITSLIVKFVVVYSSILHHS